MNKYIYIFVAFIIVIAIAFIAMRTNAKHPVSEVARQEIKPEEVVVTKDVNIAEKKQKLLKDTSGDYYLGEKFAPVVMIEYASLACPHCRDFQGDVVEPMIANYVNKGKVKYVFRHFPHNQAALVAAKLANCAEPDKYFSFIKVLFKSQDQWAYSENYAATLKTIGKLGGVSEDKFDECEKNKEIETKILNGVKNATDILSVQGVPAIYINGNLYEGERNYKDVSAYIDKQLKGE